MNDVTTGPTSTRAGAANDDPSTAQIINYVLQRAAHAHHFHELELGGPHDDWAPWYAEHMAQTFADHGYVLALTSGRGGVDVTSDPHDGVAEEAAAKKQTH